MGHKLFSYKRRFQVCPKSVPRKSHKMDQRVIFIFCLLNIIAVWSTPQLAHLMNKRGVFCGPKLTEALSMVCKGQYNSPNKRSMDDLLSYNEYDDVILSENEDDLDFPFMQKENANSFLPIRLRRKMGIVDECCHKACSLKHLSLYCA